MQYVDSWLSSLSREKEKCTIHHFEITVKFDQEFINVPLQGGYSIYQGQPKSTVH